MISQSFRIDKIALDTSSPDALRERLDAYIPNAVFDVNQKEGLLQFRGRKSNYFCADKSLLRHASEFGVTTQREVQFFREQKQRFDLCYEDCWTGFFLSDVLSEDALVILHFDDHADMMRCHLTMMDDGNLFDPTFGRPFDQMQTQHWIDAITSGVITIGSYLTPIFAHFEARGPGNRVHVRHIRPTVHPVNDSILKTVKVKDDAHEKLLVPPGVSLEMRTDSNGENTYVETSEIARGLQELPSGTTVVHFDLDFFINDFNGNPGEVSPKTDEENIAIAMHKIEQVFRGLAALDRKISKWIVATSPGFCAARHWSWLIKEIDMRIARLTEI